ncbi:hypothetical protein GGS26DRAFT_586118 [Hypomontagnella submonticulosa]|nr:hypothetical protein GGS26DRAFT_586118 [Hypomontagnella submonticulosa]
MSNPLSILKSALRSILWVLGRILLRRSREKMDQVYYGVAYRGYRLQCQVLGVPPAYVCLFDPPGEPRRMISQGEWFCMFNTTILGVVCVLFGLLRRSSCCHDVCYWVATPIEAVSLVGHLFFLWIHCFFEGCPIPENEGGVNWRD